MPGLRSLVARRRSSLASPPCTSILTTLSPSSPNTIHDAVNEQQSSECSNSSLPGEVNVSKRLQQNHSSSDHAAQEGCGSIEKITNVNGKQVNLNEEGSNIPQKDVSHNVIPVNTSGDNFLKINGYVNTDEKIKKNETCDKVENNFNQSKNCVASNGKGSVSSNDSENNFTENLTRRHGTDENQLDTKCDDYKLSDTGQCSEKSESTILNRKSSKDFSNHTTKAAMEIESTLASRGVTVVRRMVDSSEPTDKAKLCITQNTRVEKNTNYDSVISADFPITKGSGKDLMHSLFRTVSRNSDVKDTTLVTSQDGSSVQSSRVQINSSSPRSLYNSITSRGTLVRSGLKSPPTPETVKLSTQSTFQSSHNNAVLKSNFAQSSLKGSNVNANASGSVSQTNNRGQKIGAMQRGLGAQSTRKGYTSQFTPDGPAFQNTPRGAVLPTHLRGPVSTGPRNSGYLNCKGPYQYSSPKRSCVKSNLASMSSQLGQLVSGQQLQPTVSQPSTSVGLIPQSKIPGTRISAISQSVGISQHSRLTELSKQVRSENISPQTRSTEIGISLPSRSPVVSPMSRSAEVLSPQSRSADRSPQSRSAQMSPQTVLSAVHAQSRYTGMSPQSKMAEMAVQSHTSNMPLQPTSDRLSPQLRSSVHPPQSASAGPLPGINMVVLSPPSSTAATSLPPHTSGVLSQANSVGISQIMPSTLPHMISSGGFSSITPSTEYLGRSTSESFPYNTHGGLPTTTSTESFTSHLNPGEFNMHSSSGVFPTQTNLVGFPSQNSSCGFSEHPNSGSFTLHNSGGVIGQTNSAGFSADSNCSGFATPVNLSGYHSQSSAAPFNVLPNLNEFRESSSDILTFPGSVPANSREFSGYNTSDHLPGQSVSQNLSGHTSLRSVNPSSRELTLQNCNQELPLPSNAGNSSVNSILGGQFSQSSYGESLVQPTYRESPLNQRSNPGDISVHQDFRETPLRHNYRETSVPSTYNNYRELILQNNPEASRTLDNYRNGAIDPNVGELQVHGNTRAQNSHASFKQQSSTPGFREHDILNNYLETSVLPNFRGASNANSCGGEESMMNLKESMSHNSPREENMSSYRENVTLTSSGEQMASTFVESVSHSSPRGNILSSYSESASHTSPKEQVLSQYRGRESHTSPGEQMFPNYREPASHNPSREQVLPCFQNVNSTSPREQILPSFRENISHIRPRESIHSGYQESVNNVNSKHEVLSTFREPINFSNCREPLSHTRSCDQSINLGHKESLDYTSACRESVSSAQDTKICYKGTPQHISPLDEPSLGLKYKGADIGNNYIEPTVLPSFTESFDQTSSGDIHRKKETAAEYSGFRVSSSYSTPRSLPEYNNFKESCSPTSKSPEYGVASSSFIYRQTEESYTYPNVEESQSFSCVQNSNGSHARVPTEYFNKKESPDNSVVPYSPSHSAVRGVIREYNNGPSSTDQDATDTMYSEQSNFQETRDSFVHPSDRTSGHEDISSCMSVSVNHPAARDCPSHFGTDESQINPDVRNMSAQPISNDHNDELRTTGSFFCVNENSSTQQNSRATPPDKSTLSLNTSDCSSSNKPPSEESSLHFPVNTKFVDSSDKSVVEELNLTSLGSSPNESSPIKLSCAALPSSPSALHQSDESPKGSKSMKSPVSASPIRSPCSSSSLSSPGKFSSGSPTKLDSGASPSSQERIVIKMKLLHSDSSIDDNKHNRTENANITELGSENRNSVKYPMAKYTRWTIDSIINGRGDLSNDEGTDKVCKDDDKESESVQESVKEGSKTSVISSPKRTCKRRSSESCSETKETKLDTNKNLMKPLRITIANPLRTRVSPEFSVEMKGKERKGSATVVKSEEIPDEQNDNVQPEPSISARRRSSRLERDNENQAHLFATRKLKVKLQKSPISSSTTECLTTLPSASSELCRSRKYSQSSDRSVGDSSEGNDGSLTTDVKKCSIVIKRIYTEDNSSCYSSSLCDKNSDLYIDQNSFLKRPKRKAALDATEKCHKFLKSLDTKDKKQGTVPFNGLVKQNKKLVSIQFKDINNMHNNVPRCSVLLYDVFMNRRINQMVCPGCSRHYDSSDSVQVNINKATISLLCSSCQWLVVKDAHPREVDSMAPS